MLAGDPVYYKNNKIRLYRFGRQRTIMFDGWSYASADFQLEAQDIPPSSVPFVPVCVGSTLASYGVILTTGYISLYKQSPTGLISSASNVVGSVTYYV